MTQEAVFSFDWDGQNVALRAEVNDEGALVRLSFAHNAQPTPSLSGPFARIQNQLAEYFSARRESFELPLALVGSPFQKAVWAYLRKIPFGVTRSYGEVAVALGDIKKTRAVGRANGQNPVSIIVPCHRVIGKDGTLTGYAGGIENKRRLLRHEGALLV